MKSLFVITLAFVFSSCAVQRHQQAVIPEWMKGNFTDDYGINYTINDSVFQMDNVALYHILSWNKAEQYLLVQNDKQNKSEKELYTRIDYSLLPDMQPYTWAFCFTIYNATTPAAAEAHPSANRTALKTGCNGYPFSRLKRIL